MLLSFDEFVKAGGCEEVGIPQFIQKILDGLVDILQGHGKEKAERMIEA